MGFASAIVWPFTDDKPFRLAEADTTVVPCPHDTRGLTCVECRLCLDDSSLFQKRITIAFRPHGPRKELVRSIVLDRGYAKAPDGTVQLTVIP